MSVLRFLLSVLLLGFAAKLAQADGEAVKANRVALPAPQSSVAVTVERGVRVWRPLGTDASGAAYYPQSASVSSGSEPSVQYVTPNSYGVTGVYGGISGSQPIHGAYGRFEILNWAVKFFLDAQMLERSLADSGDHGA